MHVDLAVLTFPHVDGAERAFADARERAADTPWVDEVAFVERRARGRIVIRGTFAGRYLDVDDTGDALGRDTVIGTLTGALAGAAFGWFGFAAGLVYGGMAGALVEAEHIPQLEGELFDELRADVPQGSSAVMLLAAPEHVDAMIAAFDGSGGRLVRRTLSEETLAALIAAAAGSPPASPPVKSAGSEAG
jgi:uncharacterized membrane protein